MVSIYLLNAVITNMFGGNEMFSIGNIFDFVLAPIGILVFAIRNHKFQLIASIIFSIITTLAFLIGAWGFV